MTRTLTNDVITQINSAEISPILLFEAEFASTTFRGWTGVGDLSYGGNTYLGTGNLISVSNITEESDGSARGISVTLNGLPSSIVYIALSDVRQNKSGKIYLGFLDNGSLVSSPVLVFEGRLDVPTMNENPDGASLTITYESRLIDLERPRVQRYTHEDQQRLYSGDLGCEFVPTLQDLSITWGKGTNNNVPDEKQYADA